MTFPPLSIEGQHIGFTIDPDHPNYEMLALLDDKKETQ